MKAVLKQNAEYGDVICAIATMMSEAFMDYFLKPEQQMKFASTIMMLHMSREEGAEDDSDE